jgi:hypothetical protein
MRGAYPSRSRIVGIVLILVSLLLLSSQNGVSSQDLSKSNVDRRASPSGVGANNTKWSFFGRLVPQQQNRSKQQQQVKEEKEKGPKMGQAIRMVQYDRTANERNAVHALNFVHQQGLHWYRLDDGVMGGQSSTTHSCLPDGRLHFTGEINTNGGGFCSIRAPIPDSGWPASTTALRLVLVGDGKLYKCLLSSGTKSTFGPSLQNPSWQADIATTKPNPPNDKHKPQVVTIPFTSLVPSWGAGPRSQPSADERNQVQFQLQDMKEIGIMLSLRRSDGSPNPKETFGEGIFPFSLQILSIEPVVVSLEHGAEETQ